MQLSMCFPLKALSNADLHKIVDAAAVCCQGYDIPVGAREIMARPLYNWLLSVKIRILYRRVRCRLTSFVRVARIVFHSPHLPVYIGSPAQCSQRAPCPGLSR